MLLCRSNAMHPLSLCILIPALGVPSLSAQAVSPSLENEAVDFVWNNRPAMDRDSVTRDFVRKDVQAALQARGFYPWGKTAPWEIYRNNVLPYAFTDETRSDWRTALEAKYRPIVADCKTAREAVLRIAANMTRDTGVFYSAERRKPNMSPSEALQEQKVSCTGQSTLLAAALRSVGIPSRLVGITLWSHIMGNHTWTEAWFDGQWHMIEFNEKEFNTPWVMENIGMLDTSSFEHKLIATSWEKKDPLFFPMIWKARYAPALGGLNFPEGSRFVPGVDVSERYVKLARDWYEKAGLSKEQQRLFIDSRIAPSPMAKRAPLYVILARENGEILEEGYTPDNEADMRAFLRFSLPRIGKYKLIVKQKKDADPIATLDIQPTDTAVQLIYISPEMLRQQS